MTRYETDYEYPLTDQDVRTLLFLHQAYVVKRAQMQRSGFLPLDLSKLLNLKKTNVKNGKGYPECIIPVPNNYTRNHYASLMS